MVVRIEAFITLKGEEWAGTGAVVVAVPFATYGTQALPFKAMSFGEADDSPKRMCCEILVCSPVWATLMIVIMMMQMVVAAGKTIVMIAMLMMIRIILSSRPAVLRNVCSGGRVTAPKTVKTNMEFCLQAKTTRNTVGAVCRIVSLSTLPRAKVDGNIVRLSLLPL